MGKQMDQDKLKALAAELAKDIKSEKDLGTLTQQLIKLTVETALNAEMDHHLGHDDQAGNNRNGYGRKTVVTDTGKIEIEVPRDRQGSFDPQLIAKYQRELELLAEYRASLISHAVTGKIDVRGLVEPQSLEAA